MTTRTYRTVAPTGQVWPIAKWLIIAVLALFVVVPLARWIGERRMVQQAIAHPATSIVELSTNLPELPILHLTVESVDNGYILTDVDGDQFLCRQIPIVLSDMELCPYHATIQGDQ